MIASSCPSFADGHLQAQRESQATANTGKVQAIASMLSSTDQTIIHRPTRPSTIDRPDHQPSTGPTIIHRPTPTIKHLPTPTIIHRPTPSTDPDHHPSADPTINHRPARPSTIDHGRTINRPNRTDRRIKSVDASNRLTNLRIPR